MLKFWKCFRICQKLCTYVFFFFLHKKDWLYIFSDCRNCAHLFMDKLHRHRWKARYWFAQKPVSCKLTQLCNFCRQLSGPFCHLSPQQPFQEGGNYQSTPLLLSTTHQTHERNEENPPPKTFEKHAKYKIFRDLILEIVDPPPLSPKANISLTSRFSDFFQNSMTKTWNPLVLAPQNDLGIPNIFGYTVGWFQWIVLF